MKKSYHSIVVPMAEATATRFESDVGATCKVLYHRGAYHATTEPVSIRFHAQRIARPRRRCRARDLGLGGVGLWYRRVEDRAGCCGCDRVRHDRPQAIHVEAGTGPRSLSMIHVENLVKTFGEVKAVDGVSFDVPAGEIF